MNRRNTLHEKIPRKSGLRRFVIRQAGYERVGWIRGMLFGGFEGIPHEFDV